MIKRFPFGTTHSHTNQRGGNDGGSAVALHAVEERGGSLYSEEDTAWVRWLFQSARLRCGTLLFQPHEHSSRAGLLTDWRTFLDRTWLPFLAPAMLTAWRAMGDADEPSVAEKMAQRSDVLRPTMTDAVAILTRNLTAAQLTRSVDAGSWVLENTRGAKYQGCLGKLRQRVDNGEVEPHLPVVWAATAVLFQLTPAQMLSLELGEEWHAAAATSLEPQGLLGFSHQAHGALRQSGLVSFSSPIQVKELVSPDVSDSH